MFAILVQLDQILATQLIPLILEELLDEHQNIFTIICCVVPI